MREIFASDEAGHAAVLNPPRTLPPLNRPASSYEGRVAPPSKVVAAVVADTAQDSLDQTVNLFSILNARDSHEATTENQSASGSRHQMLRDRAYALFSHLNIYSELMQAALSRPGDGVATGQRLNEAVMAGMEFLHQRIPMPDGQPWPVWLERAVMSRVATLVSVAWKERGDCEVRHGLEVMANAFSSVDSALLRVKSDRPSMEANVAMRLAMMSVAMRLESVVSSATFKASVEETVAVLCRALAYETRRAAHSMMPVAVDESHPATLMTALLRRASELLAVTYGEHSQRVETSDPHIPADVHVKKILLRWEGRFSVLCRLAQTETDDLLASEWPKYVHADAETLKRVAAPVCSPSLDNPYGDSPVAEKFVDRANAQTLSQGIRNASKQKKMSAYALGI